MKTFSVTLLPGNEGDCIWVEYGEKDAPKRLLIDGGRKSTYKRLRARIETLPEDERTFELFVCTHVDRDHIEGAISLLDEDLLVFEDCWFNAYKHLVPADEPFGPEQGETFSAYLATHGMIWNAAFDGRAVVCPDGDEFVVHTLPGGLRLTLLSPTRAKLDNLEPVWRKACLKAGIVPGQSAEPDDGEIEDEHFGAIDVKLLAAEPFQGDHAEANGSSIALVAEYGGKRVLLGADVHPDVLAPALQRLAGQDAKWKCDLVKVPHHGSSHNMSAELAELIECEAWAFSTNGSYFHHPSPAAVARVIKHGHAKQLVFNYRSDENAVWDDDDLKAQWGFETVYPPPASNGEITISLL